jgi:hypothetical protein
MTKQLQRAKQKYKDNLRNYLVYKDIVEDHYCGSKPSKTIKEQEFRMNACYDVLETLVYIFGEEVRKD